MFSRGGLRKDLVDRGYGKVVEVRIMGSGDTAMARYEVREGDALEVLRDLPSGLAQLIVTSPPYWGLRSYLHADDPLKALELGSERTPDEYVGKLVAMLGEARRVLRDDGLMFVNVGDSHLGGGRGGQSAAKRSTNWQPEYALPGQRVAGIPAKSLALIPERLALALQADGWVVRSQIVWAKGLSFCPTYSGSVMPSSDGTKPTPAHETVWMLAPGQRYWSDFDAVREGAACPSDNRKPYAPGQVDKRGDGHDRGGGQPQQRDASTRNIRNVWAINPQGSDEPHFAMYPEALVRPIIRAGCPAQCCPECGAGWRRVTSKGPVPEGATRGTQAYAGQQRQHDRCGGMPVRPTATTGFAPTCACHATDPPIPGLVLDPFSGMATSGMVALAEGRRYLGIELNPKYAARSRQRLARVSEPMFVVGRDDVGGEVDEQDAAQMSMFGASGAAGD